jgi:hypothetical protein
VKSVWVDGLDRRNDDIDNFENFVGAHGKFLNYGSQIKNR